VDKFGFCIADAQLSKLEEILGKLCMRIKSDYKTDTLSGNYEILYTKYVKPFFHQSSRILMWVVIYILMGYI
jgi:hypothetical protein